MFGNTKKIGHKAKRDKAGALSYSEVFWTYMLASFVLFATYCLSVILFLKVPKLVRLRDALHRNTFITVAIVLVQLGIAITLMLSVIEDFFDISLAVQLILLVIFGCLNGLLVAHT